MYHIRSALGVVSRCKMACRFGCASVDYTVCLLSAVTFCLQRTSAVDDSLGGNHRPESERRHYDQGQNDQDCKQEIEFHFLPPARGILWVICQLSPNS